MAGAYSSIILVHYKLIVDCNLQTYSVLIIRMDGTIGNNDLCDISNVKINSSNSNSDNHLQNGVGSGDGDDGKELSRNSYPLHKVAFDGNVRELSVLLRQGHDVTLKDPHGKLNVNMCKLVDLERFSLFIYLFV